MNEELRSALLRAVQYRDVEALLRFPPGLFQGEEILLTDESNGAQLPLLAMAMQEVCTIREGRQDNWDDFLNAIVRHCNLDMNKPFEIFGRPTHPSVIKYYDRARYPEQHVYVMQPMDVSCRIHTNPLSWAFYLYIKAGKGWNMTYLNSIISLIYLGANVNTPFLFQITNGRLDPKGDRELNDMNGHSFLHFALERGNEILVKRFLGAKAKFNSAHDRGSLAKSLASAKAGFMGNIDTYYIFDKLLKNYKNGYLDAADLQVLRSADPTNGNTAFHYLALYEKFQEYGFYIDFLLDIFASPFARNYDGLTPLEVLDSTETRETRVKQYFREKLVDAMQRWDDLVMRTMLTHEALQARGLALETQEEIARSVSGTFPIDERMSRAASIKGRILAARQPKE